MRWRGAMEIGHQTGSTSYVSPSLLCAIPCLRTRKLTLCVLVVKLYALERATMFRNEIRILGIQLD